MLKFTVEGDEDVSPPSVRAVPLGLEVGAAGDTEATLELVSTSACP